MSGEKGPLYSVELIDALPLGSGGMKQAMPSRSDLYLAHKLGHTRLAAGFEVLLAHYRKKLNRVAELEQVSGEVCERCGWAMKFPGEACFKCESERLQAIVDKLVVLGDGTRFTPHMEIWELCGNRIRHWRDVSIVDNDGLAGPSGLSAATRPEHCYSTLEAAEAAREASA